MDAAQADDLTIPSTAVLWRRVYPGQNYIHEESDGSLRATSLAFDDSPDGDPMSMFLAEEVGDLERVLEGHESFGLARISAAVLRENGQIIVRDPSDIPGHVLVIGRKSTSIRRSLAKAAQLIVPPAL